MKSITRGNGSPCQWNYVLTRVVLVAGFLFALSPQGHAFSMDPGGGSNNIPYIATLDSWSFYDNTNWTSDKGFAPVSYANLDYSFLGSGSSLIVDSANPAWLQFKIVENSSVTNLAINSGSAMFWFAPRSWSGTNQGGTGPGEWARLFEAGAYTTNSSFGWWSIYTDPAGANLYFSTQTNDLSGNAWTYLSAPIAWTTNYFHFVALIYSATNTALYLDSALVATGPGVTVYPGASALANGFFIGSDSNGVSQAKGSFNAVATYNVPLDADTIQQIYKQQYEYYLMNPLNTAMFKSVSDADFTPSTGPNANVVTGLGNLLSLGAAATCASSTTNFVWITNTTAVVAADGSMSVTFTIEGGVDGVFYDVFANSILDFSSDTNRAWAWMGQGQHCQMYSLANLPNTTCYLILGSPQNTDGDALTDAYEKLVSKTNPNNPDTDGDGIPDGWSVLLGLNPLVNVGNQPSARSNYGYTLADWLNGVSGIRSGSIGLDNEGNVQSVSQ